jgi:hypothetical protein
MDDSLLPKLKRCTDKVVARASKPGGLLEKDEFTMAVARRLITAEMGLGEGELDGKEWKKVVKEEVTRALVCPLCSLKGQPSVGRAADDRRNRNLQYQRRNRNRNLSRNPK